MLYIGMVLEWFRILVSYQARPMVVMLFSYYIIIMMSFDVRNVFEEYFTIYHRDNTTGPKSARSPRK
jgi:hypothetical protein